MKLMVHFSDGDLVDATLVENDETALCVTRNGKSVRHCLIALYEGQLVVYKVIRKGKQYGPVRVLLSEVETKLKDFHNRTFNGIVWGYPSISKVGGVWTWFLNEIPILDETGTLTVPFQLLLEKYTDTQPDTTALLEHFHSVRDKAVFKEVI